MKYGQVQDFEGNAEGGHVSTVAPNPGPNAVMQGALTAVSMVIKKYADQGKKDQELADGIASAKAIGQFQQNIANYNMDNDPTDPDYTKKFGDFLQNEISTAVHDTKFQTQEAPSRLIQHMTQLGTSALVGSIEARRNALESQAGIAAGNAINDAANRIRLNPDSLQQVVQESDATLATLLQGAKPTQRDKYANAMHDDRVLAYAEGLFNAGRFNEANAVLNSDAANGIDQSRIRSMLRYGKEQESQLASDQSKNDMVTIAHIEDKVNAGLIRDPGMIDKYEQAGLFKYHPGSYASLKESIRSFNRRSAQEAQMRSFMAQQISAIQGLNPYKPGDLNKSFDMDVSRTGIKDPSDQRFWDITRSYTSRGFIPEQAKEVLKTWANSGDPADVARASDTAAMLQKSNPGLDLVGDNQRMAEVQALKADGLSTPMAVQQAMGHQASPEDQKRLKEVYPQARGAAKLNYQTDQAAVAKALDIGNSEVSPADIATFQEMTRQAFISGQPLDTAQKTAAYRLGKTHGKTYIGGAEGTQQFAPETMVQNFVPLARNYTPEQIGNVMDDALKAQLQGAGVTPGIWMGGKEGTEWKVSSDGAKPYQLVTDDQTRADVAAGRVPSYGVLVRTDTGFGPVLRENGQKFRYTLPTGDAFLNLASPNANYPTIEDQQNAIVQGQEAKAASQQIDVLQQRKAQINAQTGIQIPGKGRSERQRAMTPQEADEMRKIDDAIRALRGKASLKGENTDTTPEWLKTQTPSGVR